MQKYIYFEKAPFEISDTEISVVFHEGWTYPTLKILIERLQDIQFEGQ